jgi:hypothetical protein
MSISYAPSENIVKITGISEKCPLGFFLITQVRLVVQRRCTFSALTSLCGAGIYSTSLSRHMWSLRKIRFPHCGRPKLRDYTVAVGAFASPSSSPRFLARYAETLARFMHRSEQ